MNSKTRIHHRTGRETSDLRTFIAARLQQKTPLLAWAEPQASYSRAGQPGRIVDFRPFIAGKPDWPADVPLVEARLFWADSALHVVAEGTGCRWAELVEDREGDEEVSVSRQPVLGLRDGVRFGLSTADWPSQKLVAIAYSQRGRLVGWRLLPEE